MRLAFRVQLEKPVRRVIKDLLVSRASPERQDRRVRRAYRVFKAVRA